MDSSHGNFQYTNEEIKAIENAMKQKEFRELLVQYVEEISDPKNKEEYDQYLKQLEGQQELPKGMSLIHPTACFCLKTKLKHKKNTSFNQKLFVNICQAPELEKPSQEKDKKNNKENEKGQQWHIPYSCSKIRMDQDKDKNVCQTVDVAFNPLTFEFCRKSEAFKKMICEISIEGASKQLQDPDEVVSKDYKILKRMSCKGGKPAAMPVRLDAKPGEHGHAQNPDNRPRNEDYTPKLYQEFVKQQSEYKSTQQPKPAATTEQQKAQPSKVVELASHEFETIQEKPTDLEEEEEAKLKKIIAPKYSIVHSYGVEYSDFLVDGPDKGKKIPKQLVVKIEVPRVQKMKDLDLDINARQLILKAANKYYLDIALPYQVNADEGSAKFDSKMKVLTITLPTIKDQEPPVAVDSKIEEIEARQEEKETPQEEDVEETNENPSALKFVTEESQKKYREEQEKIIQRIAESDRTLVEEVGTSGQKEAGNQGSVEGKKGVDNSFGFMNQETFENYFFIFNVPGYNSDAVKVALLEDEILFSYEDSEKQLNSWVKVTKGFVRAESQINFVKDYIVVNLKKAQGEFWESNGWQKQNYSEEFPKKMKQYEEDEERREKERKERAEKEEEANKKPTEYNEVDEEVEEKEEQSNVDPIDKDERDAKRIEERYVEKRSLNFINFSRDNMVFEID